MSKKTIPMRTAKTTDVKRVLSSDAKRMLTQLLSNAIELINADEITNAYHLGLLASHLELMAEIADEHDHFEKVKDANWSDYDDICERLQAGEDWEAIMCQGYENLRTSKDEKRKQA